jgi:hypothetical protein
VNLLRLFQIADERDLDVHPAALGEASRKLKRITPAVRRDPAARAAFLSVAASTHHQLGNTFGMEVKLDGFPAGVAALTPRPPPPPLTPPTPGKDTTESEHDSTSATNDSTYFCFSFDDKWEIAEGNWTIQVLHEGKVIAEKTFKIIVPLN